MGHTLAGKLKAKVASRIVVPIPQLMVVIHGFARAWRDATQNVHSGTPIPDADPQTRAPRDRGLE